MRIYHKLSDGSERRLALAIGFFDGFHLGHREIARLTLRSRAPGRRAAVLTFAEHPSAYLRPGNEPPLLTTEQERLCLFAEAGFDECFFVPFDERIATLSPVQFLEILVERLRVATVAVGETFRFGHGRAGDTTLMREFSRKPRRELSLRFRPLGMPTGASRAPASEPSSQPARSRPRIVCSEGEATKSAVS